MSVALTEQAVVERRKTVTRHLGWWEDKNGRRLLKPGDRLTLCRKVMGRRTKCAGPMHDQGPLADFCPHCDGTGYEVESLVRLADVEVTDVSRQQLAVANTPDEAAREGFPDWSWGEFVAFFCNEMRCKPEQVVTRIEFRYLAQGGQS